jgi:hypothetical protein
MLKSDPPGCAFVYTLRSREYKLKTKVKLLERNGNRVWRKKETKRNTSTENICFNIYCLLFATGWMIRGSKPVGSEISRTSPDQPWGPPSLLYNGYRVPFPRVKREGRGVNHPLPSNTDVKERVELYLYSPSAPSWPVLGWNLPVPIPVILLRVLLCEADLRKHAHTR